MNFQRIAPVEPSKDMLEPAFRKAREKGKAKKLKGNWLEIIRKKESLKLDIIKDNLVQRLEKILLSFPNESDLSSFYVKLMKLTLDFPQWKRSLGAIDWAVKRIRFFHKNYVSKIVKTKERGKIKDLSREFYGRIASVLRQIDKNLVYLENCRKLMRTYPDIKEMFTICVYGFPNVGKTTLLNKMTGAKAQVEAYAFTTVGINSGFFEFGGEKIQVLDVPGTLARQDKMNNVELQAELVLEELADVVVYVFDLSGYCGYSVKRQEQLWQKLKQKKKKAMVYLSKKDLVEEEIVLGFKHKHLSLEEIKEKIGEMIKN